MPEKAVFQARRVANADLTGWLEEHAVVVEDGQIASVMSQALLPGTIGETHRIYDLGDVSLLPGLVEAHVHMHLSCTMEARDLAFSEGTEQFLMRATVVMRRALLSGTTTMRDLGTPNNVAFPIKAAIESGVIAGPRLICSGAPITSTGGHCWFFGIEADTAEEVVRAIRSQVKLGARVVKIMATDGLFMASANPRRVQYPAETLRAAVEEAERLDVPLAAHTLAAQGTRNCAEAGVHHVIHARWLSADPAKGLEYDPDAGRMIADKGLWVDPTVGHLLLGDEARAREGLPPRRAFSMSPDDKVIPREEDLDTIRGLSEMGIRFTTGLDMTCPYAYPDKSAASAWAFHEQLGWDTWRAIRAATLDTAEALRVDREVGALKPGLLADMAAFNGDPAQNIRDLDNATTVVQSGRPVKLQGEALV